MARLVVRGRGLVEGTGEGEILVSPHPISFYGGVDPVTGVIKDPSSPLRGKCVEGKILIFPYGKGSTVGSYVLLSLKDSGKAPAAIVNILSEPIIIVGCVLAGIPLMDKPEVDLLRKLKSGERGRVVVKGKTAYLEVMV